MDNIVVVDGEIVNGGGQVLRNSSAYAAILGKSVHFKNIRVNRRTPGLRPQYLEGLEVVAKLSKSKLVDAFVDSQEVHFVGGQIAASVVPLTDGKSSSAQQIHTKDAAISLLLQASLPVLLFSPTVTDLVFTGGAKMLVSPSIDYMKHVLVPLLEKHFNVTVNVDIARRDFMPSGDALVNVRTYPTTESLPPIRMRDRGRIVRVSSILYGYGRADQLFIDEVQMALNETLRDRHGVDMNLRFSSDIQGSETDFPLVCRILVYAETSTGCILGGGATIPRDRHNASNSPKELATSAVLDLDTQLAHGGCTDEYLQDQLVIFMALADGVSEIVTGPITPHTCSAVEIAHLMTDAKFEVIPVADSPRNVIRCEGIGHLLSRSHQQASISSVFLTCAHHRRQDFGDMFKHVRAT